VLGLVYSVLCHEIGWEERLRSDISCVEWDVTQSISESVDVISCEMVFVEPKLCGL